MGQPMRYEQAEAWLDRLQMFKIKLGLETTRRLLEELGNPQNCLTIIHIAGTNGKGSVGATLQSIYSAAGYRTGFYSSPHLHSVRERFSIDGRCIPPADFTRLINRLANFFQDRIMPTYFECTTLLALLWFAEQRSEMVILETGMGGRLDATNVVTPVLTVITDISRDHEQHLGCTIEAIAAEKAGIIKPGIPVICSGRAQEAVPVIAARCQELGCPLFLFDREFSGDSTATGKLNYRAISGDTLPALPLSLRGDHQVINTCLALAALEVLSPVVPIPPLAMINGLARVRWPGRMELLTDSVGPRTLRMLLDGAHNEAGVAALVAFLHQGWPRKRLLLLWGNMADKRLGESFAHLIDLADLVVITRTASERSASPTAILAQLSEQQQHKTRCLDTVPQALEMLRAEAEPEDLICVAGSLYLVGRVRQLVTEALVA